MSHSSRIQVLPDEVANQIAAGEVVDRPASVAKELVENAVDAGARQIDIEVLGGGKQAIVVADDGRGMSRDDAILSIERHATSKIRTVHDIERVATLGFRGEALAAISSVSRFTLTTRIGDSEIATELNVAGGKLMEVREAGGPVGTRIAVRQLFFNVPARKKFLRADNTELAHVRQLFLVYALAHPEIGFKLRVDDRDVHQLPPTERLEDRIRELYGAPLVEALRPVDHTTGGVRVHGFASIAQVHRADRSEQYIFVNGRPAAAPTIHHAINEAYQAVIPRGRYPVLFLFIELDPGSVDVNVHPTKKEVRFREGHLVRDAVMGALRRALTGNAIASASGSAAASVRDMLATTRNAAALQIPDLPTLPSFTYPRAAPLAMPEVSPSDVSHQQSSIAATPESPWSWCRILGQVGGLYVVMETADGMILMDPHAAHERVMFEKFMKQVLDRKIVSQGLLVPESIKLDPESAEQVRRNLDVLQHMGFGVADFGGDTFLVDGLPSILRTTTAMSLLADIAASLEKGGVKGGTEHWAEERIAKSACRAAVKANDRLTIQEIEALVVDLSRCQMPYTCPHGRPTTIFTSFHELARKFGRE